MPTRIADDQPTSTARPATAAQSGENRALIAIAETPGDAVVSPEDPGAETAALAERDILAGQESFDQGRYAGALELFESAVDRLSGGNDHALLVYRWTQLAAALRTLGRHGQARRALDAALEHADHWLGPDSLGATGVHNEMGVLLKATGDYDLALTHYHLALPILVAQHGESCEPVATLYHNLGGIHFVRGDLPEAARWARRGLDIRRDVCGPDDITVVFDEAALVPILIHQGEYGPARALLDVVLPRLQRQFGPAHYEVAVALTNLGALDAYQRRWEQAVAHLHRAAEIKRNALGPDSPELIRTLANLAFAAERTPDPILARRSGAEALRIARTSLSPSHPLRSSLEACHARWLVPGEA